jgi:hypothetical protein
MRAFAPEAGTTSGADAHVACGFIVECGEPGPALADAIFRVMASNRSSATIGSNLFLEKPVPRFYFDVRKE